VTSSSRRGWQGGRRGDPSLPEILYVLQERRLMVIGVVLILAGAALLLGLFRDPVYTAEAAVGVTPEEELSDEEARETFMQEVQGRVAMQKAMPEVMRRAGWERGPAEFAERLDPRFATRNGETGLRVRFSGLTPEQAARAANAYAGVFVQRADNLNDGRLAGGTLVADASLEGRATPAEGSGPRPLIYAALAAGAGLLLGGAAALLLEGRASGWRGVRDAELNLRAPVLGTIPDYSSAEVEG
jgi:capsular polysaccharide biosynthesis protein